MGNIGYLVAVAVAVVLLFCWSEGVKAQSSPRAFFVFGDSLVDSGNNNYLATEARADMTPYGIDYPTHRPTGRFSNGLHIPDLISERLGAEPVLPYLDPSIGTGSNLLRGANFASAGVGILNDTGYEFVNILRMPVQLEYFREYRTRVAAIIGRPATDRLVANSLVSITLGGNDYVNNYYLTPISARGLEYNLENFTTYIVYEYKKILARIYELGARNIMVTAVGPLGCAPAERAMRSVNGTCDPTLQRAASLFNRGAISIVNQLNRQYGGSVFTFADTFRMNMYYINNPREGGFETAQIACCGQGRFNGIGTCNPASIVCPNRTLYLFWDPYHPSEKACRLIVGGIMIGNASIMYPVNLKTMLHLDV